MKKTIRKPENWQDFESLCKKLWGEIWKIPNEIKKNGRSGQKQNGVDIVGLPEGKTQYWGLQCKGKDEYTNSKLTEASIDREISEALLFEPVLEAFIIATTANKDVEIEKYVRQKNIESIANNRFKIILYCWEDIADLLEENPNILDWYLHDRIGKFDFKVLFNNLEDSLVLKPVFEKEITKYKLTNKSTSELLRSHISFPDPLSFIRGDSKINMARCNFDLVMANTGGRVIEDWRFTIKFTEGVSFLGEGSMFPILSLVSHFNNKSKTAYYHPRDNGPLIQKDDRFFKVSLIPDHSKSVIKAEWQILARDFNCVGNLEINIEVQYIEKIIEKETNDINDLDHDEIYISDYRVEQDN